MAWPCLKGTSPGRRRRRRRRPPSCPGPIYVVKAQIHAGGRGAGHFKDDPAGKGGVRLAKSPEEAREAAEAMIGKVLITKQTGEAGRRVSRVYVEAGCDIKRELYLSLLVDRDTGRVTIIASTEGGMEIEHVAETQPGEDPARRHRPGRRHLRLPRPQAGLRPRPAGQAGAGVQPLRHWPCTRPSPSSTAPSSRSTRWW